MVVLFTFLFFSEFLARFDYERNSGIKFFSRFLGLSHPVLAKNNAGKRYFSFFEFFCCFFRYFISRVEYDRNSGLKFFTLFLGLFQPVLDRNNAGINFFIFLLFFLEFSYSGQVWREFGSKTFFPLLRPIASRLG